MCPNVSLVAYLLFWSLIRSKSLYFPCLSYYFRLNLLRILLLFLLLPPFHLPPLDPNYSNPSFLSSFFHLPLTLIHLFPSFIVSLFFLISHPVYLMRCDGALIQLSYVRLKDHSTELKISNTDKLAKPGRSTLGPVPSAPMRQTEKEEGQKEVNKGRERNAEGIDLSLNYKIRPRSANMTQKDRFI